MKTKEFVIKVIGHRKKIKSILIIYITSKLQFSLYQRFKRLYIFNLLLLLIMLFLLFKLSR
jgi:hypothetical protein